METKISVDGTQVYNCNDKYQLSSKEYSENIINELPFKPLSSIGEVSVNLLGLCITVDIKPFFGRNAKYNYYSDKLYSTLKIAYDGVLRDVDNDVQVINPFDITVLCKGNVVTLNFGRRTHVYTLSDDGKISSVTYNFAYESDVLTKTNNREFTPTSDYNPATKKYVDDSIVLALSNPGTSLFLKSPDESTFRVTVDNDGNLFVIKV